MFDLKWMRELVAELPELKVQRSNMISVAGYPNWEIVVSNYLAFYLDSTNEHNFNRLFLNSLLGAYDEMAGLTTGRSYFDTDDSEFTVEREYPTNKGGRIDIVVMESSQSSCENENEAASQVVEDKASWAILIENKLHSALANDLGEYWNSVKAKSKIAVVLTLEPIEINNKHFVNITHKKLIERVLINLSEYYIDADDRHLLFLKEYIMSLESHYRSNDNTAEEKVLRLFKEDIEQINSFKAQDRKLLIYVSNSLFSVMRSFGFPPSTGKNTSLSKYFHVSESREDLNDALRENIEAARMFRFWFYVADLRFYKLTGHFELWSPKFTRYGAALRKSLEALQFTGSVKLGSRGGEGKGYYHIYDIDIDMRPNETTTIEEQIKHAIEEHRIQWYIESAVKKLSSLLTV